MLPSVLATKSCKRYAVGAAYAVAALTGTAIMAVGVHRCATAPPGVDPEMQQGVAMASCGGVVALLGCMGATCLFFDAQGEPPPVSPARPPRAAAITTELAFLHDPSLVASV